MLNSIVGDFPPLLVLMLTLMIRYESNIDVIRGAEVFLDLNLSNTAEWANKVLLHNNAPTTMDLTNLNNEPYDCFYGRGRKNLLVAPLS